MGGWQCRAVCREAERGGAGELRHGRKHYYAGPFEGERKISFLGLPGAKQLGLLVPFWSLRAEIALLIFNLIKSQTYKNGE